MDILLHLRVSDQALLLLLYVFLHLLRTRWNRRR